MNNKKGLSAIVATLLIILLTLVAVGIIWIVIRNVVQQGTEQISIDAMCVATIVDVTRVATTDNVTYEVTVVRRGGSDPIAGVKLVFTSADGKNSAVTEMDLEGLKALESRTETVTISDYDGTEPPVRVSAVVYFLDSSNNPVLCNTATMHTFK